MAEIISKSITREVEDYEASPEKLRSLFDRGIKSWVRRFKSTAMMTGTQNKESTLEILIKNPSFSIYLKLDFCRITNIFFFGVSSDRIAETVDRENNLKNNNFEIMVQSVCGISKDTPVAPAWDPLWNLDALIFF